MFDSIFIGTSGLIGFSKALRVVSNNLANVNTPGFKGSQLQFGDYFYAGAGSAPENFAGGVNYGSTRLGTGLNTLATDINFRAGTVQTTGNDLDLAINGNGFFVLHDAAGKQKYTRDGSLTFNNGFLIERSSGLRVQGFDVNGKLGDIGLSSLLNSAPKVTGNVILGNNLPSDSATDVSLSAVQVFDQVGGSHTLTVVLHKTSAGNFSVTTSDGVTPVGVPGAISFTNGVINPASSKVNVSYTPAGGTAFTFVLDFSAVTSNPAGSAASTLAVTSQDGYAAGTLTGVTFDADGKLKASYSNAQTVTGATLALASFDSEQDLRQLGGNLFDTTNPNKVHIGRANTLSLGSFTAQAIEGSNVDLAQEFSNLIVMQRGYQASSRVVSTANELIQELFDMKGHN